MRAFALTRFAVLPALIAVAAAAPPEASPFTGTPVIRNYSAKEIGANSRQVWSILRDRAGLLYVGTSFGYIHQYDGSSWRMITVSSTVVRSMATDDSGRIWVGGDAQFGYLAPDAHGAFKFVSLLDKVPQQERAFSDVWQILPISGAVYFRSYERLFRWDGQRMRVWQAGDHPFQALSLVRGRIYTDQTGIGLEEIAGDELKPLPGGGALAAAIKVFVMPLDGNRVLISERNGLLSVYDGQTVAPFHTAADDYLKASLVYITVPLADGGFCVSTLRGGAVILDHDGGLRRILRPETGLIDSGVLSAYQDS